MYVLFSVYNYPINEWLFGGAQLSTRPVIDYQTYKLNYETLCNLLVISSYTFLKPFRNWFSNKTKAAILWND